MCLVIRLSLLPPRKSQQPNWSQQDREEEKKTKLCIKIKLCSKLSIPVIFVGGGVVIIASPDFENKIESKHWNKC